MGFSFNGRQTALQAGDKVGFARGREREQWSIYLSRGCRPIEIWNPIGMLFGWMQDIEPMRRLVNRFAGAMLQRETEESAQSTPEERMEWEKEQAIRCARQLLRLIIKLKLLPGVKGFKRVRIRHPQRTLTVFEFVLR